MNEIFEPIQGASGVLVTNGVYSAVPLYLYNSRIYAKTRKGFLRLLANEHTSDPRTRWRGIHGLEVSQGHDGLTPIFAQPKKAKLKVAK